MCKSKLMEGKMKKIERLFLAFIILFLIYGSKSLLGYGGCTSCDPNGPISTGNHDPKFSPDWSIVKDNSVKGTNYILFLVKKGYIYKWSTLGSEDYSGDPRHPNAAEGQKMDTELTLLKGTCSSAGEILAFNDNAVWKNQSEIEWKADFTGEVFLLVTQHHCKKSCDSSGICFTTTVKWQRTDSSHCKETPHVIKEDGTDLHSYHHPDTTFSNPPTAPKWYTIGDDTSTTGKNEGENLLKAGDYQNYQVEQGKIYRWVTCNDPSYDTQLSLFRGSDISGEFLAYSDDSGLCGEGSVQSSLEWQSDYNGTVSLITNQYNCNYCRPDAYLQFDHCSLTTLRWQRADCHTCKHNAYNNINITESVSTASNVEDGTYFKFHVKSGVTYRWTSCLGYDSESKDGDNTCSHTAGFGAELILRKDRAGNCNGRVIQMAFPTHKCPDGCEGATLDWTAPRDMDVELLVTGNNCNAPSGKKTELAWHTLSLAEDRFKKDPQGYKFDI
jgi:hypothetical protein